MKSAGVFVSQKLRRKTGSLCTPTPLTHVQLPTKGAGVVHPLQVCAKRKLGRFARLSQTIDKAKGETPLPSRGVSFP